MLKSVRLTCLAACLAVVSACGGGGEPIASKETAAAVLFGIGGMAQGAGGNQMAGGITASAEVECPDGGKMKYAIDASGFDQDQAEAGEVDGTLAYKLTFDGCQNNKWDDPSTSEVEEHELKVTGELDYKLNIQSTGTGTGTTPGTGSGNFEMFMKGELEIEGTFKDSFSTEITQTIQYESTGTSASVKIYLNGYIETSSEKYTFDNEEYAWSGATN